MSWERRPLAEVADFCLGKMLDQRKNRGDYMPYLANLNVQWGEFKLSDLREMRFSSHEIDRYGLKRGDIVMCEGGEPGRCAIWKDQVPGMMFQKALHRIRPNDGLSSAFLYYQFLKMGRRNEFVGLFTGSTIKHLPREKLAKVEVEIPPFETQEKIASILSSYDDLIENNRRRIALLEEAARQLYKEWFVRFRYPGHEHVPIVDGVPEGWEKKKLFDLSTPTYGFAFKSTAFTEKEVGLPIVRIRDVPNGASATYTPEESSEDKIIYDGDFLIGMDGDFHINFWSGGKSWLNQRVVRIAGRTDCSTGFLRYAIEKKIQDFNETISGTTVKHLGVKHLKTIALVLPPKALMNQTNAVFETTRQQITTLAIQSRALGRARDLLLPKLMNGEIVV